MKLKVNWKIILSYLFRIKTWNISLAHMNSISPFFAFMSCIFKLQKTLSIYFEDGKFIACFHFINWDTIPILLKIIIIPQSHFNEWQHFLRPDSSPLLDRILLVRLVLLPFEKRQLRLRDNTALRKHLLSHQDQILVIVSVDDDVVSFKTPSLVGYLESVVGVCFEWRRNTFNVLHLVPETVHELRYCLRCVYIFDGDSTDWAVFKVAD